MIPNTKRVIEDSEESKAFLSRSEAKSTLIGEEEWERFWKAKEEYFRLKPFEQGNEKSNGSRMS